jgi:hypothetical protein
MIAKLFYLGVLATFAVSLGLSQRREMEIKIPFDFTAANRDYSAGTYNVGTTATGLALLQNENGHAGFVSTIPLGSEKVPAKPCLKFNRYGSQYFLSEIWTSRGMALHKSKAEKRLVRNSSPLQVASIDGTVR